ncbi:MAG: type II toxin-antitoxin system PemK/MazF family toxin [Actinomycetota bacterium]|nr:type II toxin-antitoxin system PemK/MazF family toxin [Actinomycetota bacterium]
MNGVNRGDVFDVELPELGVRPAVVATRQEAIPVLARVTVVVVTSTVRGHPAEVPIGVAQGLDYECVANCDDIVTIGKHRLTRRRGSLRLEDLLRLDEALKVSLGLS